MDSARILATLIINEIAAKFGHPDGWAITDSRIVIPLDDPGSEIAVLAMRPEPGKLIINASERTAGAVGRGRTIQILPLPEDGKADVFKQARKAVNSAAYAINTMAKRHAIDLVDSGEDGDAG